MAIYRSRQNYYWTPDWTPEMYILLARAGFISVSTDIGDSEEQLVLLPEIQRAYAVLDWENLHISKSTRRWMRSEKCRAQGYHLDIHCNLQTILTGITNCHYDSWVREPYRNLLEALQDIHRDNFTLLTFGLSTADGSCVAGEIGYRTGNVYTSLTGFHDRSMRIHNHAGKLQLYLLGQYLRDNNYAFWNLGHPYMQYKLDLGAQILDRISFLERWFREI